MPRPTKEQIDAEIVDAAAALFARYGYEHASLQQIANEVGYSKAGVLNRFSSKEALFRLALRTTQDAMSAIADAASALPEGAERDRALFERLLEATWERPGAAALMQSLISGDPADLPPEVIEAGSALTRAFGVSAEHSPDERLARLVVAANGVQAAAMTAARREVRDQWRPHIIAAAMDTLGHHRDRSLHESQR
ncbi:TetR/AcrR family transcriptional regulator [Promicromonospora sukumoe]|uniref:TetR/AcrR family transcriptional regulator n=1 Tax=Promicromonospora sukumoe TaxID=88382 RepID=UPI0036690F3D